MPNLSWFPRLKHFGLRGDVVAGITGALLAFPQAIALAALAGMPLEYGIYASIIPITIAALWGSSWHAIGGTNTAMAMLLASTMATMSVSGVEQYVAIVLIMTLLAGVFQLAIGLLSLGRILDFISSTVVATLTLAVAISMMIAVLPDALGSDEGGNGSVLSRIMALPDVFQAAQFPAIIISLATISFAFLMKKLLPRYAFLLGLSAGIGFYWIVKYSWPEVFSSVNMLDKVSFDLISIALPDFSLIPLDQGSLVHIIVSAASLALLGMTQAVVIARSTAQLSEQRVNTNREIAGQGMANVSASLFSGFAISSSFSSTATNYHSGANSPFSAVIIALLVCIIGLLASEFLTLIPIPVIAGGLMFIAITMFKVETLTSFLKPRHEFLVFFVTLLGSLTFGLVPGVLAGVMLSSLVYLWFTAHPRIHVEEQTASNGRPVHIVTIEGSLFFGAVQEIETVLRNWTDRDGVPSTLVLRTDQISYVDVPGTRLLLEEAQRRLKQGSEFYLYVVRDSLYEQLEKSHLLPLIGKDKIIRPNRSHPMNNVLFPYQQISVAKTASNQFSYLKCPVDLSQENAYEHKTLNLLLYRLKMLRVFRKLKNNQLKNLIDVSTLYAASPSGSIATLQGPLSSVLILLTGEIQIDTPNTEIENKFKRTIREGDQQSIVMPNVHQDHEIRSIGFSHYLLVDNEDLVRIIGQSTLDHKGKSLSLLDLISPELLKKIQSKLSYKTLLPTDVVIKQGDKADYFYILLEGEAEVSIYNLLDGSKHTVAKLTAGDSFGEEGILQEASRNAEVRMISEGKVGMLMKTDFNELLMPVMSPVIEYEEANKLVRSGVARWLDCRFEPEYSSGKLPDALMIPLNQIRQRMYELEQDVRYIVYCSNGRRSRAAAFLLKERNIDAAYLKNGLLDKNDLIKPT